MGLISFKWYFHRLRIWISSGGSIIGAAFCAGMNNDGIYEYEQAFHWLRLVKLTWPVKGFVSFDRLSAWIESRFGKIRFDDMKTPFSIVAADLRQGVSVVLNQGEIASAVQASCSLLGLVKPVERMAYFYAMVGCQTWCQLRYSGKWKQTTSLR